MDVTFAGRIEPYRIFTGNGNENIRSRDGADEPHRGDARTTAEIAAKLQRKTRI